MLASLSGCPGAPDDRPKVESTVQGEPQQSLESVISANSDDPDKAHVARFLIGEARRSVSQSFDPSVIEPNQHRVNPTEVRDYDVLTPESLQHNIDLAFDARERLPWARALSLENFTRLIAPYRCSTTAVDQFAGTDMHWREVLTTQRGWNFLRENYGVQTSWDTVSSTMQGFSDRFTAAGSSEQRAQVMREMIRWSNTALWNGEEGLGYVSSNAQEKTLGEVLQNGGGRCSDMTHFTRMFHMAWGIPTTMVRLPAYGHTDDNHQVLSTLVEGSWLTYDGLCSPREGDSYWITRIGAPKIYRLVPGRWDDASALIAGNRASHPWHLNFYLGTRPMVDVTDEYWDTTTLRVPGFEPNSIAYLNVMNNFCADDLAAVAAVRADGSGIATFENVGTELLYFVGGSAILAHSPDRIEHLNRSGTARDYSVPLLQEGVQYRLHRWTEEGFAPVGGVIDGAQTNSVTLDSNTVYAFRKVSTAHDDWQAWTRPIIGRDDGRLETR